MLLTSGYLRLEPGPGRIAVPTLFIWREHDQAILESGAKLNSQCVTGPFAEYFLDAGHWLIQEAFDEVSVLILEHLETRWRGRTGSAQNHEIEVILVDNNVGRVLGRYLMASSRDVVITTKPGVGRATLR